MILKIVAIRDRAADVFGVPTFVASIGSAVRSFGDEVKRQGNGQPNPLNSHPEDFDLYYLGEYDDQEGAFAAQPPSQIAIGKDYA